MSTKAAESPVHITRSALAGLNRVAATISLRPRHIRAALSGSYISSRKGRGMEFVEVRQYQPGDDIRQIDWRVTARTGQPHTKVFREERERPCMIVVDLQRSMFFATRGVYKSVLATRAASLLAWSAHHQGDRIGGLVFNECDQRLLKPRRGQAAVLRLIDHLVHLTAHPASHTQALINEATQRMLSQLSHLIHPGSLVVFLSDFRTFEDDAYSHLARLAMYSNLILILIYDPFERQLPVQRRYRLFDDDREFLLHAKDIELKVRYHQYFQRRIERFNQFAHQPGVLALMLCTVDDPLTTLRQFLGH